MEAFFRRLDIYTKVTPNEGMMDTISVIMVEVLNFIGIATKEVKQGRTSKLFLYKQVPTDKASHFRKIFEEIDRKERHRGCAEEIRQADTRGGSNGCCATPEGHEYDR